MTKASLFRLENVAFICYWTSLPLLLFLLLRLSFLKILLKLLFELLDISYLSLVFYVFY